MPTFKLNSAKIQGYRPFRDFLAPFGPLEVVVGANGSGKSSLMEFLKFLRDSLYHDIPPEVVAGSIGQQVFHLPGPQRIVWGIEVDIGDPRLLRYEGEIMGPVGRPHVVSERVRFTRPRDRSLLPASTLMEVKAREGWVLDPKSGTPEQQPVLLARPNQLALSIMSSPAMPTLYGLREYLLGWRFYNAMAIASDKIRSSVVIEQEPTLREDAGNLSSVLHYLVTEHPTVFDELQQHLRSVAPGFKGLAVKARGGPGEVIAFWREEGVDKDLTLADVSDGILRLICWITLCLQPNPPPLICLDEPDLGVHPRTLPVLAGLLEKASERTQIILATHSIVYPENWTVEHVSAAWL